MGAVRGAMRKQQSDGVMKKVLEVTDIPSHFLFFLRQDRHAWNVGRRWLGIGYGIMSSSLNLQPYIVAMQRWLSSTGSRARPFVMRR